MKFQSAEENMASNYHTSDKYSDRTYILLSFWTFTTVKMQNSTISVSNNVTPPLFGFRSRRFPNQNCPRFNCINSTANLNKSRQSFAYLISLTWLDIFSSALSCPTFELHAHSRYTTFHAHKLSPNGCRNCLYAYILVSGVF